MGHRIVLLEFANSSDAELVVQQMQDGGVLPGDPEVVGVIARPTVACECDMPVEPAGGSRRRRKSQAKSRQAGYYRSNRFGWWIHSKCHRPTKPVINAWIAGMLNGANDLLPVILGTGPAKSANSRWEEDTGFKSDAPPAQHFDGGPNAKALEPRRSRRSRH